MVHFLISGTDPTSVNENCWLIPDSKIPFKIILQNSMIFYFMTFLQIAYATNRTLVRNWWYIFWYREPTQTLRKMQKWIRFCMRWNYRLFWKPLLKHSNYCTTQLVSKMVVNNDIFFFILAGRIYEYTSQSIT